MTIIHTGISFIAPYMRFTYSMQDTGRKTARPLYPPNSSAGHENEEAQSKNAMEPELVIVQHYKSVLPEVYNPSSTKAQLNGPLEQASSHNTPIPFRWPLLHQFILRVKATGRKLMILPKHTESQGDFSSCFYQCASRSKGDASMTTICLYRK